MNLGKKTFCHFWTTKLGMLPITKSMSHFSVFYFWHFVYVIVTITITIKYDKHATF